MSRDELRARQRLGEIRRAAYHGAMVGPERWLKTTPAGLYCAAGDFYIDPVRRVERAVITHGHGDHARPGHGKVLATAATLAIMVARYGDKAAGAMQRLDYGERVAIGASAPKTYLHLYRKTIFHTSKNYAND